MNFRDLQNQIEILYTLREDGSKDNELARLAGLNACVGEINKNLYLVLTKGMPITEMRENIESELLNLLTFAFGVASYYDMDMGERLEVLQNKVLDALTLAEGGEL